jgi:hypothetical protein
MENGLHQEIAEISSKSNAKAALAAAPKASGRESLRPGNKKGSADLPAALFATGHVPDTTRPPLL